MSDAESRRTTLAPQHLLLALAAVAVWGTNFAVIKVGVAHIPPLAFATLRFIFVAFPALLFVTPPRGHWRGVAAYGVLNGAQFGLLFLAMRADISPGLASLVIQTQVFFTVGLGVFLLREAVNLFQVAAMALAACGLGVIAAYAHGAATPYGLVLTLLAALSWAASNVIVKRTRPANMFGYVVWAGLFSVPPLLALAVIVEGWAPIAAAVRAADGPTWIAVLWQSTGNTLFAFGFWNWLLTRYPAAVVTPFALLVPVFGFAASAVFLGEPLEPWKWTATALVLGGLAINLLWPIFKSRKF